MLSGEGGGKVPFLGLPRFVRPYLAIEFCYTGFRSSAYEFICDMQCIECLFPLREEDGMRGSNLIASAFDFLHLVSTRLPGNEEIPRLTP
jgi:hypothetical protein